MATRKNYVFTALVTDEKNPLELMAYAIYKADKNEIAENLAAQQLPSQAIDAGIKKIHDLVLSSPSILLNYRVRARTLGVELLKEMKDDIKREAKDDFIERVEQMVKTEMSWHHHLGSWMTDAVKGVLSTIFVIIIFGGVYSLFLTKEERTNLYSAAGQSLIDVATGEIPVVDKYREEKAKRERESQERAAKEQAAKPQN
ncbi:MULTISPECIES: hypothetical protein [Pantoea]|uniref:Uncharacterized protein n=1 Tax=Pantoea brenneri TaxID=472694 RepID=A0ABU9MQX7_9GAMM|nr:hypothetical protein [Pantoea sp. 3.5.1]KKD30130.1 hypothetical protein EP46_22055 [Pantoea sp. 3.5.1]